MPSMLVCTTFSAAVEILVEKRMPETPSRIRKQRINRPTALANHGIELGHALESRQIALHRLGRDPTTDQAVRGVVNFGFIGGNDHVETIFDAQPEQARIRFRSTLR